MKKYLGIIKEHVGGMAFSAYKLLTKTSDDINELNDWIKMYPKTTSIILNNTLELDAMFKCFEDLTPTTKEEKEKSRKLYKDLMN